MLIWKNGVESGVEGKMVYIHGECVSNQKDCFFLYGKNRHSVLYFEVRFVISER